MNAAQGEARAGHDDGSVRLTLVAAMASNRVIGRDNTLPWRIPEDLRRFKALTLGKAVLMGRLTFESIGRALPGRDNLVLSRRAGYRAPGCQVFTDLQAAIAAAGGAEVMVIGGEAIYRQTLPLARRMCLTHVDVTVDGDAFFPCFDEARWLVEHEEAHRSSHEQGLRFRFVDYRRL